MGCNVLITVKLVWNVKLVKLIMFGKSFMLLVTSPATPLIPSIKFLDFKFLGTNFLVSKSSHSSEKQPVLGPDRSECEDYWPLHILLYL